MKQLTDINQKTLDLLDEAEKNPELSLKCISEIRNQIRWIHDDSTRHYVSVAQSVSHQQGYRVSAVDHERMAGVLGWLCRTAIAKVP